MGIIDEYLNNESSAKSAAPETKRSGLIEQYLNSPSEEKRTRVYIPTKPPISGVSSEASADINATPAKAGGDNPRDSALINGILNAPANTFNSIVEDAKSGISTIGEGASDIFKNKSASGVGKIALGALSTVVSPVTGASKELIAKPVAELTGNKKAGEIAEIVSTGGLPLAKATKATIAALPKNKALSTLIESIGPENAGAVAKAMRENSRLTPADLSPKVLQDTQHLFANDGPQINYLKNASDARMASRKSTIEDAYDASAGTPVNVVTKLNELAAASKKVGNDLINPVIEKAGRVSLSNTLSEIDTLLNPAKFKVGDSVPLTEVKKELQNIQKQLRSSKEYEASELHSFQSKLRTTAQDLLKSADGGKRQLGQALMEVRNNVVTDIDNVAPGYKKGLSSYRDEMHIADAFRDGYSGVFSNSKKMENRPEFTEAWFNKLTDAEKEAAREGARTAIGTEIGVAKNGALSGEALARSDFNKEKLEILFGKDEAAKLIKALDDERTIANTHNKIIEGSQTAMRAASKEQFALPEKTDSLKSLVGPAVSEAINIGGMYASGGGLPGLGVAAYTGLKGVNTIKDAISLKLARERNASYAKYAMPVEAPKREELIKALEAVANKPPKQSLLSRASSLSSLVAQ